MPDQPIVVDDITVRSNGSAAGNRLMRALAQAVADRDMCERQSIAWLSKTFAVVAVHPDDGWVDREANTVRLVNPTFRCGEIRVGGVLALGWPDDGQGQIGAYRIVRVTRVIPSGRICECMGLTQPTYAFEPIANVSIAPTAFAPQVPTAESGQE